MGEWEQVSTLASWLEVGERAAGRGPYTAAPCSYFSFRGAKTKPQLCLPLKIALSTPFEDLGLGRPARLAKIFLRFSLKKFTKDTLLHKVLRVIF